MKSDPVPFRRLALLTAALTVFACALPLSLAAAAPATPDPSSLGFATETVGRTSTAQTALVSDPDPGTVQLTGVSIVGTDPGDFSITGESCAAATLVQTESCQVEVTFSPSAGGVRTATLEIAVEGEATIEIPLSGTGQTMRLTAPPTTVFPTASVGGSSTQQISLKNESEAGVNVNEVKVEGVDPGDFAIDNNNCSGYVGVGMGCSLTIRFTPGASGPREALLHVLTDGSPSDYVTELAGEGVAPTVIFEPSGHDFGLVELRSGSPRTNFVVRNTGAAPVQLGNPEITGPDTNEFWVSGGNCGGATLLPGATCAVEVQFNDNEEGSFSAAVTVAAGSFAFTAPLTARAERPKVSVSPAPAVFGPTSVGSRQIQEVTLTNVGNLPVGFFIAIVSGGDVSSFHLLAENCTSNLFSGSPRIFEPGESCTAKVAFEPDEVGARTGILSFFGGGEGALQVSLEGTAVAPELSLSPSSHDFGSVVAGDPGPTQTFQLRNGSTEAQTIESAGLAGPDLGEFSVRSDECSGTVVEPGATCAVTVRFDPGSSGPKTATLRVRGTGGTLLDQLSGGGTAAAAATASSADRAAARGRVVLNLKENPRLATGRVTVGTALCASSQACEIRLSGLVSGRLATGTGSRPGIRGIGITRLELAPGAQAMIVVAIPPEGRGSRASVGLRISLHWRTGNERGAASRSFRPGES